MRSLEKQLPLAAFGLLALVAGSLTVSAVRGQSETTRALFGERLMRLSTQLGSSVGPGLASARDGVARAAEAPVVIRALTEPQSVGDGAAAALLSRLAAGSEAATVVGVWDLAGAPVVTTPDGDSLEWLRVPPPLVDEPTVTPLQVMSDTLIHYGIVAPVRDGRRLVGFVQIRRRLGGGGAAGEAIPALVGESAVLLLGSGDGVWTDLRSRVDPPPPELTTAPEAMTYERGGIRRFGYGRALDDTGLVLATEVEERVVLAPTYAFMWRIGLLAAVIVLGATVGAWILGRRITVPLTRLREAAIALGEGEYGVRASESGHAEIVEVARTFNKMASETEDHVSALKASEQRFRSLATATAQIVWWTDPDGSIGEPLPSWQSYTGLSFEESRGSGWTSALHPDDAELALAAWKEAVKSRSMYEAEYRIRRHDGEYRLFVVRFVPVLNRDGTIREWVGTGTDVTRQRETAAKLEQKEAELRQAQRLDAIGRLAGGIAHDFNNLLSTILIPAELAQKALPEDDPVQQDLVDIHDAAQRAGALTKKLLAFGRQQVLAPALLDVNKAVGAATRLLERVIGESITLRFVADADEPTAVVDPTQFEQVIVNLAVNARDAMPDGGSLTIETSNTEIDERTAEEHPDLEPGRYVVVAVTDTGIGMDEETQGQIFEPFFTTKSEDQGTGLGLATVYGIVRQSGGHVLVYSEVGHGTSFKVLLPFASPSEAPAQTRSVERDAAPPKGSETVLLAEDDEHLRRIATRILADQGYEVIAARDGEEALRMVRMRAGAIDLLVTDLVMPGLGGVELWEQVRSEYPSIPALFLSGWASNAAVGHGVLDGQVPFLQKPFSTFEFAAKVRDVLDGR